MTSEKNLIVICGPTGSGKTDLSIELALHYGSPIISTDSRQLYRGMAIGTAQPDAGQLERVPHYFIASHDIREDISAGRFEREALEQLDRLFAVTDTVVAVGGSGLYIDALCHGMDPLPVSDPVLRSRMKERFENEGLEPLLRELRTLDPEHYERVDKRNPKRVIRALEVCIQTGQPYSRQRTGEKTERDFGYFKIGVDIPRDRLYDRIDERVDRMMTDGLEDEARGLYPYRELNSLQTVGYREMFDYFDGTITREQAVELIKRNSRRYAKRQMTWFRRDGEIKWFAAGKAPQIIEYLNTATGTIRPESHEANNLNIPL